MNEAATDTDDSDGAGSLLDQLVGPFYDADGVTSYLTVTDAELSAMVAADHVIAVPLAAGTPVFPAWQFRPDRRVDEQLLAVWRALRGAADPWTAACWMCAPSRDLDGETAIAFLTDRARRADRLQTVLARAAEDCARWLQ
ncbi:MAG: hypothetical protein IJH84_06135 [Saccharopolyspora sp.]|uniref:Uncharacterized protein n=1 Tax=Tsukamurella spumae TaxID=44753 RepID=A0A846X1S7_9ACTN|nr:MULTISPECIES: hypothetical protein [Actinomycetes]MBQ6640603.1 hypothetical protein [Saccharopolyspora sp.]NKY19438.1 hypothetical protein [Tsukamurella spumae]